MKKIQILFVAVALLLSGCGRDEDKTPAATGPGTTAAPAEFITFVKGLFGATSDTEEPVDIETTTFTGADTDDETAFDSLLP